MVLCAVYGCKSHNKKLKNREVVKVSFFRFPREPHLMDAWVKKCSRTDKFNVLNARICSLHFEEDCFERNLKDELLGRAVVKKKLKVNVIPTLCLPNKISIDKRIGDRQKRATVRNNKMLVEDALS